MAAVRPQQDYSTWDVNGCIQGCFLSVVASTLMIIGLLGGFGLAAIGCIFVVVAVARARHDRTHLWAASAVVVLLILSVAFSVTLIDHYFVLYRCSTGNCVKLRSG